MKAPRIKFAQLQIDMFYSEAYHNLNYPSVLILNYVLFQLKWIDASRRKDKKSNYTCTNKDEINLPYSMLKESPFKLGNSTITRSIDLLLSRGFLSVKEQGGREKGHASVYSYVEKWKDWKKGDADIEKRQPYRTRGFTK